MGQTGALPDTVMTAIYFALIALLVVTLIRDIRRRPEGQGALVTLKMPSPLRWVVMVLAVVTVFVLR